MERRFGVNLGVSESIPSRAGRRNVGTASGLSLCIISATGSASEPGLMAPNPLRTDVGTGISLSAVNSISGPEISSGRDSGSRL